jgi:hypothetical protein
MKLIKLLSILSLFSFNVSAVGDHEKSVVNNYIYNLSYHVNMEQYTSNEINIYRVFTNSTLFPFFEALTEQEGKDIVSSLNRKRLSGYIPDLLAKGFAVVLDKQNQESFGHSMDEKVDAVCTYHDEIRKFKEREHNFPKPPFSMDDYIDQRDRENKAFDKQSLADLRANWGY